MWGITLLQKGFPHESAERSQIIGKERSYPTKNKIGNLEISVKKAQENDPAQLNGNKRIADFIFAKERSDFCKRIARIARMWGKITGRGNSRTPARTSSCHQLADAMRAPTNKG